MKKLIARYGILNLIGILLCCGTLLLTVARVTVLGIPNLLLECLALLLIGYSWGVEQIISFWQLLLLVFLVCLVAFLLDPMLLQLLYNLSVFDTLTWLVSLSLAIITGTALLIGYAAGYILKYKV